MSDLYGVLRSLPGGFTLYNCNKWDIDSSLRMYVVNSGCAIVFVGYKLSLIVLLGLPHYPSMN